MRRTAKQKQKDSAITKAAKPAKGKASKAPPSIRGSLDGAKLRIGIVTARFNSDITSELESGALRTLVKLGVRSKNIRCVSVPGAVEITVAAQALLKSGSDAVIALGCVIRGETTHYESVVGVVDRGCTHLQLETGRPVVFGVITTENKEQALDRIGGRHGHKGEDAAEVAVEMANLLKDKTFRK